MALNNDGRYQPVLDESLGAGNAQVQQVCPFSNESADEDDLANYLFPKHFSRHPWLGRFLNTYAGHALDDDYRGRGSSGGLTSWFLAELIRTERVDAILHVRPSRHKPGEHPLLEFTISTNVAEVRSGAGSHYYPVHMAAVLRQVRERQGQYAVVAVPSFLKAVRHLALEDPVIRKRIKYHVGLFCGHLKGSYYAELLAWNAGIHPQQLTRITFRHELEGKPANEYAVEAEGLIGGTRVRKLKAMKEVFGGGDWGFGCFKYNACDFCDDVVAEVSDISFGDAWLPEYLGDSSGTNVIITRNEQLANLLVQASQSERIYLEPISPEQVVESQAGGFRHRRTELSYRLHVKDREGEWRPQKRVGASTATTDRKRKTVQNIRMKVPGLSNEAFRKAKKRNNLDVFESELAALYKRYRQLVKRTLIQRILRRVNGMIRRAAAKWRKCRSR